MQPDDHDCVVVGSDDVSPPWDRRRVDVRLNMFREPSRPYGPELPELSASASVAVEIEGCIESRLAGGDGACPSSPLEVSPARIPKVRFALWPSEYVTSAPT